jgi:hypothetical protein
LQSRIITIIITTNTTNTTIIRTRSLIGCG